MDINQRICVSYGEKTKLLTRSKSIKEIIIKIKQRFNISEEIRIKGRVEGVYKLIDIDPEDDSDLEILENAIELKVLNLIPKRFKCMKSNAGRRSKVATDLTDLAAVESHFDNKSIATATFSCCSEQCTPLVSSSSLTVNLISESKFMGGQDKIYVVVHFMEDDDATFGVVHRNWMVGGDRCFWPFGPKIKRQWLIDGFLDDKWPTFPCCVKYSSDILDAANQMSKLLEVESDIASHSNSEAERCKSRKRTLDQVNTDDSDTVMESLNPKAISLPVISTPLPIIESIGEPYLESKNITSSSSLHLFDSNTGPTLKKIDMEEDTLRVKGYTQEILFKDVQMIKNDVETMKKNYQMLKNVLEDFKGQSLVQYENVFHFLNEAIAKSNASANSSNNKDVDLFLMFPIRSKKDFYIVNELLVNDEKFKSKVIKWLESRGGSDLLEVVNSCMGALFETSFSASLNWTGKSSTNAKNRVEKIKLQDTDIVNVINCVISKRGIPFSNASCRKAIKEWLCKTYDRVAHREKRINESMNSTGNASLIEQENENSFCVKQENMNMSDFDWS